MPPKRRKKSRSPEHAALGKTIEQLRKSAGLTQEELADQVHMSFTRIGHLERGLTNPTFTTLLAIQRGLDIDLSEVIRRYEQQLRKDTDGK